MFGFASRTGAGAETCPMKQRRALLGRPAPGDVCQSSRRLGKNSPDPPSLLLLKVGLRLVKAAGSVASENCSFTAGKTQQGQPPVQR